MAPPEVVVRRATEEDWEIRRDVRSAMLLDAPRAFATTYAEHARLTEADWRERSGPQGHPTWLAFVGDRPAGSVTILWPGRSEWSDEPRIVAMWVAPPSRGTGLGRRLLQAALDHARDGGMPRVFLDVADDNEPAKALYARLGFVPTGVTASLPWDTDATESELVLSL